MEKDKIFSIDLIKRFLNDLDENLDSKIKLYMIGGGAMCLRGLKDSTFDIDFIVLSKKDFKILCNAMLKLGFDAADQELLREAVYKNAMIVFQRGESRIDVFIKNIVSMMDFSERMQKRAELYDNKNYLKVYLASNTDILLLKSLSDREKDFPDIGRLVIEDIDWEAIAEECGLQSRKGAKWIFFVFEQLCRVEDSMNIEIPDKKLIFSKCIKHWDKRPESFMADIENTEKHIPKKYLKYICKKS